MNLMLVVIFTCVVLGLLTSRCGRREQLTVGGIAVIMTALYYFSTRLM